MDQIEQWRPVLGYEGSYSVSDLGRVRAEPRVVRHSSGGEQRRVGGLMKVSHAGVYPTVQLCRDGKIKLRTVHSLVLEAFVCARPPGAEGCHNDSNPMNCVLSNLRWDTRAGNFSDMVPNGTRRRGPKHHLAKLTKEQALAIRNDTRIHRLIADEYGISVSNVSSIKHGKSWAWLSAHIPRPSPIV